MNHLLLLPGMLCDQGFWQHQVASLSDICNPSVACYGLADSIEAMAEMVLEHAPETFAVAGHSMGGRVALEICGRAPHRVQRLGLFCTDFRSRTNAQAGTQEDISRAHLLVLARSKGIRGAGMAWVNDVIPSDRLGDDALVSAILDMVSRQSPQQLAAQTRAGHSRPDYSELLPAIACPTLICAGDGDSMRPLAVHQEMTARIPNSRLIIIERAGHMVAMERPEAVTAVMREWLLA